MRNLLTNFDYKSIIENIFVFFNKNTDIMIATYIDDLLIIDHDINKINELQKQFQTKIEINDLNNVNFFLNMKIVKIVKNIVLSFTCHVRTSRALFGVNILTIVYKLYLSYIVKIQCVYHLFLTNYELEKRVIY